MDGRTDGRTDPTHQRNIINRGIGILGPPGTKNSAFSPLRWSKRCPRPKINFCYNRVVNAPITNLDTSLYSGHDIIAPDFQLYLVVEIFDT